MRVARWVLGLCVVGAAEVQGRIGWEEMRRRLGGSRRQEVEEVHEMVDVEIARRENGVEVRFTAFGVEHQVRMEQSKELFHEDFTHTIVGEDWRHQQRREDTSCVFHAERQGETNLASICGGWFTAIVGGVRLELAEEPVPLSGRLGARKSIRCLAFSANANIDDKWSCGHHNSSESDARALGGLTQEQQEQAEQRDSSPHTAAASGQVSAGQVRVTKYLKLLIVNDQARFSQFRENTHAATASILTIMQNDLVRKFNDISTRYRLQIQVVGMLSFSHGDPWSNRFDERGEVAVENLLAQFASWRAAQLSYGGVPSNGAATLFSGHEFANATVGLASVRTLCSNSDAAAVVQATAFTDEVIATIAIHELMHNVGAKHTNDYIAGTPAATPCPPGNIMDPAGIRQRTWSTCTVNWVEMAFDGKSYGCSGSTCAYRPYYGPVFPKCAEAPGSVSWTLEPTCGNGVREPGEECDCGGDDCSSTDPCCNGLTCKLTSGSLCSADDACCDAATCKPVTKSANKVCRQALSAECDRAEVCDGLSASCPTDLAETTGAACDTDKKGDKKGACYAGQCMSHAFQCALLDPAWTACPSRSFGAGANSCGRLFCVARGSGTCFAASWSEGSSGAVAVADGTGCATNSTTPGAERNQVCSKSVCVAPHLLALPPSLTCSNGVLDELESDVDCGGPVCPGCLPKETCYLDSDCASAGADRPGACVKPTSPTPHPTPHPTVSFAVLPPVGQTCAGLNTLALCSKYSACTWLSAFGVCRETGYFPPDPRCSAPEVGPASGCCSLETTRSDCCSSQSVEVSCVSWVMCKWNSASKTCAMKSPPTRSPTLSPTPVSVPGQCKSYDASEDVGLPGPEPDPWGVLWANITAHPALVIGVLAGALALGLFAAIYICVRHCRDEPLDHPRKDLAHMHRLQRSILSSRSSASYSSRASTPYSSGTASAQSLQQAPDSLRPRSSSSGSGSAYPGSIVVPLGVAAPQHVGVPKRQCSRCMVHFSNPRNPEGWCNSCTILHAPAPHNDPNPADVVRIQRRASSTSRPQSVERPVLPPRPSISRLDLDSETAQVLTQHLVRRNSRGNMLEELRGQIRAQQVQQQAGPVAVAVALDSAPPRPSAPAPPRPSTRPRVLQRRRSMRTAGGAAAAQQDSPGDGSAVQASPYDELQLTNVVVVDAIAVDTINAPYPSASPML